MTYACGAFFQELLQLFGVVAALDRMAGVIDHALAEKAVCANGCGFVAVAADQGQEPLGILMPIDPLRREAENGRKKDYGRAGKHRHDSPANDGAWQI